jgi:hypothetical protein
MYGFGVAFHFQDLSSETTADLPQCQGCGRSRRLRADLLQDWPATASTGAADFNIFFGKMVEVEISRSHYLVMSNVTLPAHSFGILSELRDCSDHFRPAQTHLAGW